MTDLSSITSSANAFITKQTAQQIVDNALR